MAALRVFGDEVLAASQIIHMQAPDAVRTTRLIARGQPPRIHVINQSVHLVVRPLQGDGESRHLLIAGLRSLPR